MRKAFHLSQLFGGIIIKIGILLISVFSFVSIANADTPYEDIKIKMSIETGEGVLDFEDEGATIEDLRTVAYRVNVSNTGNTAHENVVVLMNTPEYLEYVSSTTEIYSQVYSSGITVPDVGESSAMNVGYNISNLSAGEEIAFLLSFQVNTPEGSEDEELLTVAWGSVWGKYSAIPIISNLVENTIFGEAKPLIQVEIEVTPEAGTGVYIASPIKYYYKLRNVGGIMAKDATITLFKPDNTTCTSGCGIHITGDIEPGNYGASEISMQVAVNQYLEGVDEIANIGFDLGGTNVSKVEYRVPIIHPVDENADIEGDFMVIINQVPNLVLNSPDLINPRDDRADRTETQYSIFYQRTGHPNTYISSGSTGVTPAGGDSMTMLCGSDENPQYKHPYPYTVRGATTYAYNSNGGGYGCDNILNCPPVSSPIVFNVRTDLPQESPKFVFGDFGAQQNTYNYNPMDTIAPQSYSVQNPENYFMLHGGQINIPSVFTESRAVQNGANGIVGTEITAQVTEDMYQFVPTGRIETLCSYTVCGEKSCDTDERKYEVYEWRKVSSQVITVEDTDETNISVYSSTAWLKTEGGHIGTNGSFTNIAGQSFGDMPEGLTVNIEDVIFYNDPAGNEDDYARVPTSYIKENHPTSSALYTPPRTDVMPYGEYNADYFIFGGQSTGDMKTRCGKDVNEAECDEWYVTGTTFDFVERGDDYNRENNPRDYYEDLLVREKYGEVKTESDELTLPLIGEVNVGDDKIWNFTEDIYIGSEGGNPVYLTGGQSRIYTTGDVYINSDVYYSSTGSSDYNEITSVRIDARNIYISGHVTDVQLMLLARNNFHSCYDKYTNDFGCRTQLRILGDVIAKQSYWEREPLLENFDTSDEFEFNRPSEYIIEDMRKYIAPAPGDTEIPDDYTIWRQVNPATGEVLDSY